MCRKATIRCNVGLADITDAHSGVDAELPWIMLMSGANCLSQDYSFFMHALAAKGYLVAIVDQQHLVVPEVLPGKLCKK